MYLNQSCRWKRGIREGYWLQSTPSMSNSKLSTKMLEGISRELTHKGVTQNKCFNFLGYLLHAEWKFSMVILLFLPSNTLLCILVQQTN